MVESRNIFVIDTDPRTQAQLAALTGDSGWYVRGFSSGEAFLQSNWPDGPGCVLLDPSSTQMTGPRLVAELAGRYFTTPVVVYSSVQTSACVVEAMRGGVFDYLEKPAEWVRLVNGLQNAIDEDGRRRRCLSHIAQIIENSGPFTQRERVLVAALTDGVCGRQQLFGWFEGHQRSDDSHWHDTSDDAVAPSNMAGGERAGSFRRRDPGLELAELSPRLRQTLEHLKSGANERQVAQSLGISQYTVHDYVKSLYKHFGVRSRAALLARYYDLSQRGLPAGEPLPHG